MRSAEIVAILCVGRRREIKITLLICDPEGICLCENKSEAMPALLQTSTKSILTPDSWLMAHGLMAEEALKSEIWTEWWISVSLGCSIKSVIAS